MKKVYGILLLLAGAASGVQAMNQQQAVRQADGDQEVKLFYAAYHQAYAVGPKTTPELTDKQLLVIFTDALLRANQEIDVPGGQTLGQVIECAGRKVASGEPISFGNTSVQQAAQAEVGASARRKKNTANVKVKKTVGGTVSAPALSHAPEMSPSDYLAQGENQRRFKMFCAGYHDRCDLSDVPAEARLSKEELAALFYKNTKDHTFGFGGNRSVEANFMQGAGCGAAEAFTIQAQNVVEQITPLDELSVAGRPAQQASDGEITWSEALAAYNKSYTKQNKSLQPLDAGQLEQELYRFLSAGGNDCMVSMTRAQAFIYMEAAGTMLAYRRTWTPPQLKLLLEGSCSVKDLVLTDFLAQSTGQNLSDL